MNNDTVAGLITSIRNASKNRERTTQYSATKVTESLSQILYEEGYLEHWLRIPGKKPKIIDERTTDHLFALTFELDNSKDANYINAVSELLKKEGAIEVYQKEV